MTTPAPVYVVDDDASVRDAVGRLVRSAGWKVETFASAHEFLASRGRMSRAVSYWTYNSPD